MLETFKEIKFANKSLIRIAQAVEIIKEYQADDMKLTLRQLYYQFVARDLIPNSQREYKKLGETISNARLAGLVDWGAIEDRTRNLESNSHWTSPSSIIQSAAYGYAIDKWESQPTRVEVWIEKEALVGVIARLCERLDVPYFACRGYVSQSEQYSAGRRFRGYADNDQHVLILHLGDHDPSGIDMTRDNRDRLDMFSWSGSEVERIALNMDQVETYSPPPNPAKVTDSRFENYVARYGDESWELDALNPRVLRDLIERRVLDHRDDVLWSQAEDREEEQRMILNKISDNYGDVAEFLADKD